MFRPTAALCAALLIAGCGNPAVAPKAEAEGAPAHAEGVIALMPEQIAAAGIMLVQPRAGPPGPPIEPPAMLESDPQATRIVAASIEGRIVALTRNLGDPVAS